MNIPNLLTLSRFGLSGVMLAWMVSDAPYAKTFALLFFVAAAVTDALDGRLARRVYGVTPIGALLDPLADKVMVCCAFVGFVELGILPAWIVVLILSREFLVTGLRVLAAEQRRDISAGAWGKHKTGWQIAVIAFILLGLSLRDDWVGPVRSAGAAEIWFEAVAYVVAVGAVLITVASGGLYFVQHRDLIARSLAARKDPRGDRP